MSELVRVIEEARRLKQAHEPYILGTIVKIEGPAYRRPGARMIVRRDGSSFGLISGGCLEGEVAMHGLEVFETGISRRIVLDVSDTEGINGFGVGCGGRIHVLLDLVAPDTEVTVADALEETLLHRREIVLATVIGGPPDALGQWTIFPETEGIPAQAEIREQAAYMLSERYPRLSWVNTDGLEILLERIQPVTRLVVVGDGPDVTPVVGMARMLGWDVTVVGWKPREDLAWRFPHAQDHVFLMHAGELLSHVSIDPWTPVLLMTHHFARDGELLQALEHSTAPYVGLIGSRQRSKQLITSLGVLPRLHNRLYTPAGLDIGSETPEEIALSILAEVQAVLNRRTGGLLKTRRSSIHEKVDVSIPSSTAQV